MENDRCFSGQGHFYDELTRVCGAGMWADMVVRNGVVWNLVQTLADRPHIRRDSMEEDARQKQEYQRWLDQAKVPSL